MNNQEISKSKQKRIDRENVIRKEQKKKRRSKILPVVIITGIVAAAAGGSVLVNHMNAVKYLESDIVQESDYSAYLQSNGKIKGVKASDYVNINPEDIALNASDVEFTDDDLDDYISDLVSDYKTLNETDTGRKAAIGDTLNIDFDGTIDGTAFDGGSAEDYDIELGSGSLIDNFEDQLVGCKTGDDISVTVTFPDDYGNDDLNGKEAVFAVHVNGIYDVPEFDDDFVKENLSDSEYATADEYKEAYKKQQIANLYGTAINNWIEENVSPETLPSIYLRHAKGLMMTYDEMMFNQYKNLYEQYGLDFDYDSYQEYYATDDQTYEEYRDVEAADFVIKDLFYQSILENENLAVTTDDYNGFITTNSIDNETVETYGKPYMMKLVMNQVVMNYLQDHVTVSDSTDTADTSSAPAAETTSTN